MEVFYEHLAGTDDSVVSPMRGSVASWIRRLMTRTASQTPPLRNVGTESRGSLTSRHPAFGLPNSDYADPYSWFSAATAPYKQMIRLLTGAA